MDQWTEIRRQVLVEGMSKQAACEKYQIHWRTLAKILDHPEPPGYRRKHPPKRPLMEPVRPIIEAILESDKKAPRKQRHTAKRIWIRLQKEHGFRGGYTSVKELVRELQVGGKEVFLPLEHSPGEAQIDFGQVQVVLKGVPTKVALFVMSLPFCDAVYCQVFPKECTETFQEGHVRGFAFFGGVPRRISYDNTKTAISKIIDSRDRELIQEFKRLKGYYLFESHFCLVRRPNEKGHVERLLEYARSNFLVPVPECDSLEELNGKLEEVCLQDQDRIPSRKKNTIKHQLEEDQKAMLAAPSRPFESRRVEWCSVDSLSLVTFDTNQYSIPTRYAHRKVQVVATISEIRLIFDNRLVAKHIRRWGQNQTVYDPLHYLALLERKPGGFDFAKPVKDWDLPNCFATLKQRLESDTVQGIRGYIKVLRLLESHTVDQVKQAVEKGLELGTVDPDSIWVLLECSADRPPESFPLEGRPQIARIRVETTEVQSYGALLKNLNMAPETPVPPQKKVGVAS